jgi:hypothetical protein
MFTKQQLLWLCLALTLSSCGIFGAYLTSPNDTNGLKGKWFGNLDNGQEIRLDLTATIVDSKHYTVTGTLQLDAEEPLEFEGIVRAGGCSLDSCSSSIFEGFAKNSNQRTWSVTMLANWNNKTWGLSISSDGRPHQAEIQKTSS